MPLGQRGHLYRVVRHKGRLDEILFAVFSEYGVDELAYAHGRVCLDLELLAGIAKLFYAHALDVYSGIFLYRIEDRNPAIFSAEVNFVVPDLDLGGAVHRKRDSLKHLLGEVHHPDVVLVGYIYFHAGEFRVVGPVHALVPEVLGELVDSAVASND